MLPRLLTLVLLTATFAHAAPRPWRNTDGSKTFEGEFVKREGPAITVKPTGGNEITFDLSKLHPDDQKWVNLYHPTDASKKPDLPDSTGVFDDLNFGDSPTQVEDKLKKSPIVESNPGPKSTLFGGHAMGGEYRTKQKIGELHASLYFTWADDNGLLSEISLQTDPLSGLSYNDSLKLCWSDLIELLTALHGNPVQSAPYPSKEQVPAETIIGSHIWKLEKGGTAMLGTARAEDKYIVVVRFSKKSVEEIQKFQLK